MRSRLVFLSFALTFALASPQSASADGLPVPVDYTLGEGVIAPDDKSRFVSIGAGDKTVVMRISLDGGKLLDHAASDGTFTIPAVAVDGTASGISHDGTTLALINPRRTFPRETTEFQIYDTSRLRKRPAVISLQGDFSFDALSPDGDTMYLVEYTDRRDPGAYRVRSFDVATQELDPDPIIDSEEEPDDMRGLPQTRVTSSDGRWEYTLYDGGGADPFIHALDVDEGATVCIDVPMIKPKDTYSARLEIGEDGAEIELSDRRGMPRAVVDTATFEAREPGEATEPTSSPGHSNDEAGLSPAGLAGGGLVVLALAGVVIRRRR